MERRKIQGWRSRLEQDMADARRAVWDSAVEVLYDDDHVPISALSRRYGDKVSRRLVRFDDQLHASARLRDLRNQSRRIERAEWTDEQRLLDREKKRLYWINLDPDSKAKQIERMVEFNRVYRPENREKVNAWARASRDRNRDEINERRRLARSRKSSQDKEQERLVAVIYQQLLRLAGLSQ